MHIQLSDLHWKRIFTASITTAVLTVMIVFAIIMAYAFALGFAARGGPDVTQINLFADQVGAWLPAVLALPLTFFAAWWVARKAGAAARVYGLLVGLVVGVGGLLVSTVSVALGNPVSWLAIVAFISSIGAGWLGGVVGERLQSVHNS